jgi:hypothetical protein
MVSPTDVKATRDPRRIEARAIVEGPTIEDLPQEGLRLIRVTIDHLAPLQWPQGARITISCPERGLVDVQTTLLRSGVDLRRQRARLELVWDTRAK